MKQLTSIATFICCLVLAFTVASCSKNDDPGYTAPTPTAPTLSTAAVSAITETTATSGGTISSNGGADVTAKGVCWSTSHNPTITDSKTSDGVGATGYTSSITGLTGSTTYYVRAYATNSVGTAYGTEQSFTTLNAAGISIPSLITTAVSAITTTGATGGGTISSDGGGTITAKGVCWSTSANPTTADSKTTDGTGTGVFTSAITGLSLGQTYHVRAYATNSTGTGYGSDVSFTTSGGTVSISIVSTGAGFSPSSRSVSVGTTVTWTNNDAITHTVTSTDGVSFDSGNLAPGHSFSYTTTAAGTFDYYCGIHPSMTGTLIVTP